MNKKELFDGARKILGPLSDDQVKSIDAILKACLMYGVKDSRHIAYIFGTTQHEVGKAFKPIKEKGSKKYLSKYDTGPLAKALGNTPAADGDGILYAGRGFVQLTGRANYEKFKKILGIDIVSKPDLALQTEVAAKILVYGMARGTFTGKKLSDYFNPTTSDWKGARRIVNGTDQASRIAGYAKQWMDVVDAAARKPATEINKIAKEEEEKKASPPVAEVKEKPQRKTLWATITAGAATVAAFFSNMPWEVVAVLAGVLLILTLVVLWKYDREIKSWFKKQDDA